MTPKHPSAALLPTFLQQNDQTRTHRKASSSSKTRPLVDRVHWKRISTSRSSDNESVAGSVSNSSSSSSPSHSRFWSCSRLFTPDPSHKGWIGLGDHSPSLKSDTSSSLPQGTKSSASALSSLSPLLSTPPTTPSVSIVTTNDRWTEVPLPLLPKKASTSAAPTTTTFSSAAVTSGSSKKNKSKSKPTLMSSDSEVVLTFPTLNEPPPPPSPPRRMRARNKTGAGTGKASPSVSNSKDTSGTSTSAISSPLITVYYSTYHLLPAAVPVPGSVSTVPVPMLTPMPMQYPVSYGIKPPMVSYTPPAPVAAYLYPYAYGPHQAQVAHSQPQPHLAHPAQYHPHGPVPAPVSIPASVSAPYVHPHAHVHKPSYSMSIPTGVVVPTTMW